MAVDQRFYQKFVRTNAGTFKVVATKKGLVGIDFPGHDQYTRDPHSEVPASVQRTFRTAQIYLNSILRGADAKRRMIQIDWSRFNPFERTVFKMLLRIPLGKTISYGELARKSGYPRAARAVGNALGRNPIPILIPCHRVIRKGGTLGGYSAGLGWKKKLLKLEGGNVLNLRRSA